MSKKFECVNQISSDLQQQVQVQQNLKDLGILGESPEFVKVVKQALIVAESDVPVLIRGENGAGKEVIAKLIHKASRRKDKPFITVNCAAIPENLIESELFGYERGAFTGAKAKGKLGKFEIARGGTLFLDEIGDMPLPMQPKVLRAIQEKEIEKLGAEKNIKVDIRIIAATNQPLETMLEKKTFRMDLYYRINTVSLRVPPLRERPQDVLLLLHGFLDMYNEKYEKQIRFSESIFKLLQSYGWPGNIRELRNFAEHSVIMSQKNDIVETNSLIDAMKLTIGEELRPSIDGEMRIKSIGNILSGYDGRPLVDVLEQVEKIVIKNALDAMGGNRTKTMHALGLSRRTFYRKLAKHKID